MRGIQNCARELLLDLPVLPIHLKLFLLSFKSAPIYLISAAHTLISGVATVPSGPDVMTGNCENVDINHGIIGRKSAKSREHEGFRSDGRLPEESNCLLECDLVCSD
jgi:hypothetical protein